MTDTKSNPAIKYEITPEMLDEFGLPKLSHALNLIARDEKLNNSEIAERVGEVASITSQSIGRIRAGDVKAIDPEHLAAICQRFRLPLKPFLIANLVYRLPANMRAEGARAILGTSAMQVWQRLNGIQVATHIRIDAHTWRARRAQGAQVSELAFTHGLARMGKELIHQIGESAEESFLFRHSGTRMTGGSGDDRCIPPGALLLIKPVPEEDVRDGDFVLVQFFSDRNNPQDEPEDAAVYRYVRRARNDYAWEEYHSLDPHYPVRLRDQGKFKEHSLSQTRAILGKAVAILYTHLDIA